MVFKSGKTTMPRSAPGEKSVKVVTLAEATASGIAVVTPTMVKSKTDRRGQTEFVAEVQSGQILITSENDELFEDTEVQYLVDTDGTGVSGGGGGTVDADVHRNMAKMGLLNPENQATNSPKAELIPLSGVYADFYADFITAGGSGESAFGNTGTVTGMTLAQSSTRGQGNLAFYGYEFDTSFSEPTTDANSILLWNLNNVITDESSNTLDLTDPSMYIGMQITYGTGQFNQGLDFPGDNEGMAGNVFLTLPSSDPNYSVLDGIGNQMTVEFWVNAASMGVDDITMGQYGIMGNWDGSTAGWALLVQNGALRFVSADKSIDHTFTDSTMFQNDGTWHQYAFTYVDDGMGNVTLTAYKDGVQVEQQGGFMAPMAGLDSSGTDFLLGKTPNPDDGMDSSYFSFSIDAIHISNTERTSFGSKVTSGVVESVDFGAQGSKNKSTVFLRDNVTGGTLQIDGSTDGVAFDQTNLTELDINTFSLRKIKLTWTEDSPGSLGGSFEGFSVYNFEE